jgi:hypothetical protein
MVVLQCCFQNSSTSLLKLVELNNSEIWVARLNKKKRIGGINRKCHVSYFEYFKSIKTIDSLAGNSLIFAGVGNMFMRPC